MMTLLRQPKWKSRAVLTAVLCIIVVVSCLFIAKMRERKPFVSKVVAGYRYRCTLSNDWKPISNAQNASHDEAEDYDFSALPSPIREWIATHLFHSPAPQNSHVTLSGRPELHLVTATGKTKQSIKTVAGYPELDLGRQRIPALKVSPSKHFRIGNCPATITGLDMTAFKVDAHYRFVLVSTPDYVNTYIIAGVAEASNSEQMEREIQAILSSFHVEKVAAPTGGKH